MTFLTRWSSITGGSENGLDAIRDCFEPISRIPLYVVRDFYAQEEEAGTYLVNLLRTSSIRFIFFISAISLAGLGYMDILDSYLICCVFLSGNAGSALILEHHPHSRCQFHRRDNILSVLGIFREEYGYIDDFRLASHFVYSDSQCPYVGSPFLDSEVLSKKRTLYEPIVSSSDCKSPMRIPD